MLRLIREEEPTRPSLKISTLGEEGTMIAQHRHTEPQQLRRALRVAPQMRRPLGSGQRQEAHLLESGIAVAADPGSGPRPPARQPQRFQQHLRNLHRILWRPLAIIFNAVGSAIKQQRGQAYVPTWVFVSAYLVVWTLFGVVAYSIAVGADTLADQSTWLRGHAARLGGVLLIVGSFLTWVEASGFGSTATANGLDRDGPITLVLGLAVVALAVHLPAMDVFETATPIRVRDRPQLTPLLTDLGDQQPRDSRSFDRPSLTRASTKSRLCRMLLAGNP